MNKQRVVWSGLVVGVAVVLTLLGRGALLGSARGTSDSEGGGSGSIAAASRKRTAPEPRSSARPADERAPSPEGTAGIAASRSDAGAGRQDGGAASGAGAKSTFGAVSEAEAMAPEPIVTESLARNALRSVGKDAAADAIWLRAINDPGLPRGARSDLIEDLADTGFSDPLTTSDLPLVERRLEMIERLTPFAMDDVNAAAFREAYKDLLATLVRLRGGAGK